MKIKFAISLDIKGLEYRSDDTKFILPEFGSSLENNLDCSGEETEAALNSCVKMVKDLVEAIKESTKSFTIQPQPQVDTSSTSFCEVDDKPEDLAVSSPTKKRGRPKKDDATAESENTIVSPSDENEGCVS